MARVHFMVKYQPIIDALERADVLARSAAAKDKMGDAAGAEAEWTAAEEQANIARITLDRAAIIRRVEVDARVRADALARNAATKEMMGDVVGAEAEWLSAVEQANIAGFTLDRDEVKDRVVKEAQALLDVLRSLFNPPASAPLAADGSRRHP